MSFTSYRERARREAEAGYDRCQKAARAAASAGSPLALISAGQSNQTEARERQRVNDSAEQYTHFRGQVYTSVRPIANRIAGQPICLARVAKPMKGKGQRMVQRGHYNQRAVVNLVRALGMRTKANEEIEVIDQHPILDALHRPAPSVPSWTDWHLIWSIVVSMEMTGTGYLWFATVKGQKEIWYAPSHWIRVVVDRSGNMSGWALKLPGQTEETTLPPEAIVPVYYPDPSNPLASYGPTAAGARAILVDEFIQEAQKLAFQLGLHPSAIIKVAGDILKNGKTVRPRLKQFQFDQIRAAILSRYRGVQRFGEPFIMDGRIESMEPYGNKPKEMDFGGNMDKSQARVEQTYGTNPYIAGASSLGSRAEAAEARHQFAFEVVNPKIELISRVLTIAVVPEYDQSGQFVLFIEPAHPEDAEMDFKYAELGAKIGAYEINDFRGKYLREPPVEWGNVRVQMAPTAPAGSPAPAPATAPATEPSPIDQDEEDALGGDGSKASHALWTRAVEARDKAFASTWLKTHGKQEKPLAAAVMALFAEQADEVAKKLEEHYGGAKDIRLTMMARAAAESVFKPADWDARLKAAVKPSLLESMAAGALLMWQTYAPEKAAKDAPGEIGYDFGVDLPAAVRRGIVSRLDESLDMDYWEGINQTTKDRLQAVLQSGLDEGKPLKDIIAAVRDQVFEGEIATSRAECIARSESTRAMNGGAFESQKELADEGIVTGKSWLATEDQVTRDSHTDADGQEVGVEEKFVVGGEECDFPGDPVLSAAQSINCRCALGSTTPFSNRALSFLVKRYRVAA